MGNEETQKFAEDLDSITAREKSFTNELAAPDESQSKIAKLSRQINEQTRYFDAILSSISDFAYTFDKEGRFVFINQALLDLWGLKFEEAFGKNFFDLKYPDDLAERLQQQIQQVFDTRQRVTDETPYTSPSGVVGYYEYIFSPFFGADGAVELVVGTTRNITGRKQAEEKIKELGEQNREILESITDAFFAIDEEWRFRYVNKQAEQMLEREPGDLIGKVIWDIYPGLIGSEFEETYRRTANERIYSTLTAFYPDHDRWYEVNVYPASKGITIYFKNATERVRTEKALRESEERFRRMADHAPVMIWVTEADGTCTYLSQSWYEFTGQTPETGLGFGWINATHPEDQKYTHDAFVAANNNRESLQIEYRLRRKNGEYRWAIDSAQPRFDERGEFLGYIGSVIDITERKETEEALKQIQAETERQRRLYDTILSNTPDLVYVFNLEHRFTYANDVLLKMWDKTWDEAIGKNCLELGYEPWHAEMHDREIEQVIATKQPIRGEVPFDGAFGRRIYDYIFVPIIGANSEVEAIAGTTRDITERTQMEEALREADRRKDEFLATLAHELRNPLAPIRSGLEVIRHLGSNKTKFDETLDIIKRQTNQIVHLVDDLLDISRITQGKIKLKKQRIELKTAIEIALETSRGLIEESENELTVALPDNPIYIDADLTRIAQIFLNILNNAAKYSDPGGKISLVAGIDDTEAVISITDTGLGIEPEMIPKIFDMFGQIETPEKQSHGGLGIGLSVVKKLVEMHGGSIQASSGGSGKGSEFIVRLPLAADQLNAASAAESLKTDVLQTVQLKMPETEETENMQFQKKTRRILVVDDNHDAVEMLEILLTMEGHTLRTAFDGKTGLKTAEEFQPEICLCDIGLPEMNGYELAENLRKLLPHALLISISGWGQDEDRQRSLKAGFNFHLVKPVEFDELLKLIKDSTG